MLHHVLTFVIYSATACPVQITQLPMFLAGRYYLEIFVRNEAGFPIQRSFPPVDRLATQQCYNVALLERQFTARSPLKVKLCHRLTIFRLCQQLWSSSGLCVNQRQICLCLDNNNSYYYYTHSTAFFQDNLGKPIPER